MPSSLHFGPDSETTSCEAPILMALDEYECIRLIDYEGLTQEQCAVQMDAARTTIQALYSSARRKLAQCIVDGRKLHITGGNFLSAKSRPAAAADTAATASG